MAHELFDLLGVGSTDEESKELHKVLQNIFDSQFDRLINEAVSNRGCVYVELRQTLPN
jgi:hypothetical protein